MGKYHLHIPAEYLFPKTVDALVAQAKVFTGIEITVDPHWRASPMLEMHPVGRELYATWLQGAQNQSAVNTAFVLGQSNRGAYIVYGDYGDRWNERLDSQNPRDEEKTDMICHELGHLIVDPEGGNLNSKEVSYYREQCAVTAGHMLKAAVGCKGRAHHPFPILKEYQTSFYQSAMPYDSFCVYTPSPLARFYETPSGKAVARARYMSPSGIVRFDLVAEEVTQMSAHMRLHLETMKLFGGVTRKLACDNAFANKVTQPIHGFEHTKRMMVNSPRDVYAGTILKHWWQAAQDSLGWKNADITRNIYAGEQASLPDVHHANSYFLNLAATTQYAMAKRPHDYLLPIIHQGLTAMMTNPGHLPYIVSKVRVRCEDNGTPHSPAKPAAHGVRDWLRKVGLF